MTFYISDCGQTFGPFEEAEVIEQIRSGSISSVALACAVGDTGWKPLTQVIMLPPELLPQPKVELGVLSVPMKRRLWGIGRRVLFLWLFALWNVLSVFFVAIHADIPHGYPQFTFWMDFWADMFHIKPSTIDTWDIHLMLLIGFFLAALVYILVLCIRGLLVGTGKTPETFPTSSKRTLWIVRLIVGGMLLVFCGLTAGTCADRMRFITRPLPKQHLTVWTENILNQKKSRILEMLVHDKIATKVRVTCAWDNGATMVYDLHMLLVAVFEWKDSSDQSGLTVLSITMNNLKYEETKILSSSEQPLENAENKILQELRAGFKNANNQSDDPPKFPGPEYN
jgi:hypothetical protein